MNEVTNIIVKWSGKEYSIDITEEDTVADLKNAIHKATCVRPERQKLLNLKLKGKAPEDESKLCLLKLKPGFKLMMMGSLEEQIAEVKKIPEDIPKVINDLDVEDEEILIEHQEIYLSKIQKRINNYTFDEVFYQPRAGKKLLVLDIDYTLFDHKSPAENGIQLMRPYLHEFLTSAYEDYDIIMWSATGMKWIKEKMRILGVESNENYKIMCYVDSLAMITIHSTKYGLFQAKPLSVIWAKFPEYNSSNTIMFDDVRRNFVMNPRNGLKIKAFRNAHMNRESDNELLRLTRYLKDLATHCEDFASLDHSKWKKYRPNKSHHR